MTDETKEAVDETASQDAPDVESADDDGNPYDVSDPSLNDPAWGSDPGDEDDSATDEEAEPDRGAEDAEGEDRDDEAVLESEPEASPKKVETKTEVNVEDDDPDPDFDPKKFLDEELAAEVAQARAEIRRLRAMLDGAGIMAPKDAAISKVGEEFPDTFGKGTSLTGDQSEARSRLSDAADMLRQTYVKRGKQVPSWDSLLKVAMSVEFPDLSQKAEDRRVKSRKRESQRISRPTPRESDLSPTERAVRKARQMMLESAATEQDPFDIRG